MTRDGTRGLQGRGVEIPVPGQVWVADDVDLSAIEAGCVLLPGTRLEGAGTRIGRGARVGVSGPAALRDAGVGRGVELGSGVFEGVVLMEGARFGPSAHARAGTLFEEGASAAHAVGTKQTILFPWSTLGSNINACDLLLAGGTGPKDHSEIGSGFIHFNFTPFAARGDKATPSLFGDAVRGAWLKERRIFLGGAGGVVGPIRVGYGTVLAAGSVYRRDRGDGLLVYGEILPDREVAFEPMIIRRGLDRVRRNLEFMSQLVALRAHYETIRLALAGQDPWQRGLVGAGVRLLDDALAERSHQLERFVSGFPASADALEARFGATHMEVNEQRTLAERFASAVNLRDATRARDAVDPALRDRVVQALPSSAASYVGWVTQQEDSVLDAGRAWLAAIAGAYMRDPAGAGLVLNGG
jgi:UDP-N-acetylglucosamine/UDP-N-acetylgalactosamine diphosphorylase